MLLAGKPPSSLTEMIAVGVFLGTLPLLGAVVWLCVQVRKLLSRHVPDQFQLPPRKDRL